MYGRTCAICGFDRVVELCHLVPASIGGTIHPHNIVALCPNHHTLMDRHLLTLEEEAILDNRLIAAWASPLAARFEETSDAPSGESAPSTQDNQTG
jgi:predicted restriction endonuclease